MKLGHISAPVEVSGGNNSGTFSIATNGKAFRVLSDTLYQNKIGSIVREISCNAYDAHVMAGHPDMPFEIHLPDVFEPWFSVKDYGVGLSPDDIKNVFTVYFQSTKDNSNDTIGAFGLGAKTPFAYTDQFTVTSVKDGKKIIYSAYVSESGLPTIVEMANSDTDEPNGVEINIAVEREDFHKFQSECSTQLSFFKVKPKFTNGNITFREFLQGAEVIKGDRFVIHERFGSGFMSKIYAIQGNVGYPITLTNLSGKIKQELIDLVNSLTINLSCSIQLNFNIGEISVTASRESIEYNKFTCASVEKALEEMKVEFDKFVSEKLKSYPNDWERVRAINNSRVLQTFCSAYEIPNTIKQYGERSFKVGNALTRKKTVTVDGSPMVVSYPMVRFYEYRSWRRDWATDDNLLVKPSSSSSEFDVQFVIKDAATYWKKRAKMHFDNNRNDVMIELSGVEHGHTEAECFAALKDALGGYEAPVKLLSSLPLPPSIANRRTGAVGRSTFYRNAEWSINVKKWGKARNSIEEEIEIGEDSGNDTVYVVCDKMVVIEEYENALNRLMELRYAYNFNVIAIRKGDLDNFKDIEGLYDANEYVAKIEDELKNDKSLFGHWKMVNVYENSHDWLRIMSKQKEVYRDVPDRVLVSFLNVLNKAAICSQDYKKTAKAQLAAKLLKWTDLQENFVANLQQRLKNKHTMVPTMLQYSQYSGIKDSEKHHHVARYIKGYSL